MSFIYGIDDSELIEELLFCIRQKRVTEERTNRLITKRMAWRRDNGYRPDELLEEVYEENESSRVLELSSYKNLLSKCPTQASKAHLKRIWMSMPLAVR